MTHLTKHKAPIEPNNTMVNNTTTGFLSNKVWEKKCCLLLEIVWILFQFSRVWKIHLHSTAILSKFSPALEAYTMSKANFLKVHFNVISFRGKISESDVTSIKLSSENQSKICCWCFKDLNSSLFAHFFSKILIDDEQVQCFLAGKWNFGKNLAYTRLSVYFTLWPTHFNNSQQMRICATSVAFSRPDPLQQNSNMILQTVLYISYDFRSENFLFNQRISPSWYFSYLSLPIYLKNVQIL